MTTAEPDGAEVMVAARSRRLHALRLGSALVTLLSVAALGVMAVSGGRTVTKHTTTVIKKTEAADRSRSPVPATSDPATPLAGSAAGAPALVAPTPNGASTPSPVVTAAGVTAPATDPAATSTPVPTAAPGLPATLPLPSCPLPLATPTQTGGLESLIALSPLFGPFSAEAFASAAVFQPVLQLFGPFLVEFAQVYAAAEPSLTPLLAQFEGLENEGFSVLSPYYLPYRTKVLTAETALATALAPYAEKLVSNPAASCVVDFEGLLVPASAG
jgi:hypothetical protein